MRYLPHSAAERADMLAVIGASSAEALFGSVPKGALLTKPVDLPAHSPEFLVEAHMRALALESRCRMAWHVEAIGGGTPMASAMAAGLNRAVDTPDMTALGHLWEMLSRKELKADPTILN